MEQMSILLETWDLGHEEFEISFHGQLATDLWLRPNPALLSVGEIAGHVAYWEAVWALGGGDNHPPLHGLGLVSPLIDDRFRYYTSNLMEPVTLSLGPQEVMEELLRIYDFVKGVVKEKAVDDVYPGQWDTWGALVKYQIFHVSYHTGQVYSARHLLGHNTENN